MKRRLATFADNPSHAALTVAADNLDERTPCKCVLRHQRGRALRSGGYSKRTGADGDRTQRASISSCCAGHSDNMDCFWSCLAGGGAWQLLMSCKLKEQLTVICATVSKKRDRSGTANGIGCVTAVALLRCHRRCAFQLRLHRPTIP